MLGIPDEIFVETYRRFTRLRWWAKSIAIGGIMVALFAAARSSYLGDPAYQMARVVMPLNIALVDRPVLVTSQIRIYPPGGQPIANGGNCGEGDVVEMSASLSENGWISMFGIDETGPYGILERDTKALYVKAGDQITVQPFHLNSAKGYEAFFAIASPLNFSFANDVKPAIEKWVEKEKAGKGIGSSDVQLELGQNFSQRSFFCVRRT